MLIAWAIFDVLLIILLLQLHSHFAVTLVHSQEDGSDFHLSEDGMAKMYSVSKIRIRIEQYNI
jgi:hypothetical protein